MKFVAVPGTGVLFAVWATRVGDYGTFARETAREWPVADFAQDAMHPAVNVSWDDAREFCRWLTQREWKAGRLDRSRSYRLPRDWEWSVAAGLDERRDGSPRDKSGGIPGVYPWGRAWPPPVAAGNFGAIPGRDDGHAATSPAGAFSPNRFGLHDVGGNVREWCEDALTAGGWERTLRGASFLDRDRGALLAAARTGGAPSARADHCGFRCVLGAEEPAAAGESGGGEWREVRAVRGRFGGGPVIEAVLYAPAGEPDGFSADDAALLLGFDAAGRCVGRLRGERWPEGSTSLAGDTELEAVPISPRRDLLLARTTRSRGFTEERTTLLGWRGGHWLALWSGVTLEVSPAGEERLTRLEFRDVDGDGQMDLVARAPGATEERRLWSETAAGFRPEPARGDPP